MARRVTISSVGPSALSGGKGLSNEEAVEKMIGYWRDNVERVLPDQPDLIVVPEACDRFPDLTLDERLAYYRFRGNQVRDFFADTAKQHHCHVAYSAARELDDGTWRNSTQMINRRGQVAGIYNKNHVVIEETTDAGILCGKDAPIIECDFGRVACAICFDLNFEEIRKKYVAQKPDLIVFCSMYHGGLMQNYWAYSCRAHFVASLCGTYPCNIISPVGEVIAHSTNYFNYVTATVNLDCVVAHLDYNGEKLQSLKKAYGPGVTIHDPGYLAPVLITSETDGVSAPQMAQEFEIELIDDYWERALAHRQAHTEP